MDSTLIAALSFFNGWISIRLISSMQERLKLIFLFEIPLKQRSPRRCLRQGDGQISRRMSCNHAPFLDFEQEKDNYISAIGMEICQLLM